MSLFGSKEKQQIEALQKEIASLTEANSELQSKLLPEHITLDDLKKQIDDERSNLSELHSQIDTASAKLATLSKEVINTEETVMLQSFGLYTPHYDFMKADDYKSKLLEIRAQQKDMIKSKTAVIGSNLAISQGGGLAAVFAKSQGTLTIAGGAGLVIGSFVSGGTATPNFTRYAKTNKIAIVTTVIAFFLGTESRTHG